MKNKKWHITSFVFLTLLIFLISSCSGGNTNNNSDPENEDNPPSQSGENTNNNSDPENEDNPPSQINSYNVKFFIDGEEFDTVSVEENNKVILEKEIPTKEDKAFDGWYKDNNFTEKFDLETPITSEISLYGRYNEIGYFDNYNYNYKPSYSPLTIDNVIHEGDENIELNAKLAANVAFSDTITAKMISLTGSLANLTIDSVEKNENELVIKTTGVVASGNGSIILAKESTSNNTYIYDDVEVLDKRIYVDESSISLDLSKHDYNFTVKLSGKEFDNPDGLTPAEYIAKYNNKDDSDNNYFKVNNEAYSFTVTKIYDDFKAFDVKVHSQGDINNERANELAESVIFSVDGRAFKDKKSFDFNLDIVSPVANVDIEIQPTSVFDYEGKYHIKLTGSRLTDSFKNNKDAIINNEEFTKSLFMMDNGAIVTIKSMKIVNDTELSGDLVIYSENILDNDVLFLPNRIKLDENTFVDVLRKSYNDDIVGISKYVVNIKQAYQSSESGTYQQTASSNYSGIISVVNKFAFEDNEVLIDDTIEVATEIGKIGVGLATNDIDMAKFAVGNLLGIDSLRNPSLVIMESIASIMDKLNEIEEKIDQISEEISSIREELAQISEEALLSNFLDAYQAWSSFVTDYYDPLVNAINNYSSAYFSYYYNLVVKSVDDAVEINPTISIYFDSEGKLAYLDGSSSNMSIDGRMIDKNKTVVINLPRLVHAVVGIGENGGHSYTGIEEDIVYDILSVSYYDNEMITNIIKTLRFNAMKNYFSSQDKLNEFSNNFINFCQALTGSTITTGTLSTFTPIACFNLVLETVYNFGFEAEADLNLIKIKLGGAYYCAKNIAIFVDALSHSQTLSDKYKDIEAKVKDELTSERFYHRNDENGNIYSYAAKTYLKYSLDSIGFVANWEWNSDKQQSGDLKLKKIGRTEVGSFNTNVENYSGSSFVSISETDAKLMAIKVKVYNKVKGTNYTFKEYLAKIGMIPEKYINYTYGLALEMDGTVSGGDCNKLSYYTDKPSKYDQYRFAIKGKAMSLEDSSIFTALCAAYCKVEAETSEINPQYPQNYVLYINDIKIDASGKIERDGVFPFVCYANYVTFEPVN